MRARHWPLSLLGACLAANAQNIEHRSADGCVFLFARGATVHRADGRCDRGRAAGDWQILATVNQQQRWFHTFYNNGVQDGFSMVLHKGGGDMAVSDAKGKVVWRAVLPKTWTAASADKVEALLEKANFEAAVHQIPTRVDVTTAKQAILWWLSDQTAFFALPSAKAVESRPPATPVLGDDPKGRGRSERVM